MRASLQTKSNTNSPAADLFGLGLFLVFCVLLFVHAAPVEFADYTNWTYQGILLQHHWRGIADTAHAVKHYPVPNSASTFGIAVLTFVAPWAIAAKLWLCVQFAISFFALRHLIRTLDAPVWAWPIASAAAFFGLNLWYGFVNFELGAAWVLLFASLLIQRMKQQGSDRAFDPALLVVLTLAFLTHMIPCAFCCWLLVCYALQRKQWRVLWNLTPAIVLTLWYGLARFLLHADADGQSGMSSTVPYLSKLFWLFKLNSYFKSFGLVNPWGATVPFYGLKLWSVLFVLNLILASVAAAMIFVAGRKGLRAHEPHRFIWGASFSLLPLVIVLPGAALGISDPGARLLQTFLPLVLVLACVSASGLWVRIAAGLSTVMLLSSAILIARFATSPVKIMEPDAGVLMQTRFAAVPYADQQFYYRALERGDFSRPVFPSGLLLNTPPVADPLQQ